MSKVKVWNDNVHPFTQIFKSETISIPAKGYVEMQWDEAIEFKSYPANMQFDGMNNQKPESFKMIRVEGRPDTEATVVAYKCHADGTLHASKSALEDHISKLDAGKFADEEGAKTARKRA
jgi:hypothetical protein